MDGNLNNAIAQLQNMLSSDDGKKNIENLLGMADTVSASSGFDEGSSAFDGFSGMLAPDGIMKMKDAMETLKRHDDPRSQLLLALKPYLSSSRGAKIDTAIMLLSLGKIPSIVKIMRG